MWWRLDLFTDKFIDWKIQDYLNAVTAIYVWCCGAKALYRWKNTPPKKGKK